MDVRFAQRAPFRCVGQRLGLALVCGALAACGGGGSGSDQSSRALADPNAPSLSLSASSTTVAAGQTVRLTWQSSNVSQCQASGGWTGSRPVSGSQTVGPIDSSAEFSLNCSGSGDGVSRRVVVSVADGTNISLRADPSKIAVNGTTTLTWSAPGAESCTADGGWSGNKSASGTTRVGPLTASTSYQLTCSGSGGNGLTSVRVEVLDKTIRWQAPTQNVDGSPLTDLAGYVIYWGEQSRRYESSVVIDSAATTRWVADISPGTYYFALTAVDLEGNESGYSGELQKTIP